MRPPWPSDNNSECELLIENNFGDTKNPKSYQKMKLKDFFSSCSPSNPKKVKAVKQKYSNMAPKQRPLQVSKSQPNLEWKSRQPQSGEYRISNSKFYDVTGDVTTGGQGKRHNGTATKSGILENIDNYDLSSIAHALDTLKVGDRVVWVREFPGTTAQESGTVRWIGEIEREEIAGIEFDRELGLGSGWYKRRQLFSCAPNHGGLVAVAGLILEADLDILPSIIAPLAPSSTGSTSSPSSSASSSLSKRKDHRSSSGSRRRSFEKLDHIDGKRSHSPKLYDRDRERHPTNTSYIKSESSSPSWSSGSSGGDLASASQLTAILPAYKDYSQSKLRWQGQEDWAQGQNHYHPNIETIGYEQFNSDRASPEGCPHHYPDRERHLYSNSGNVNSVGGGGEYRVVRETDLDAGPSPSYQGVALVMPSLPYIHPPLGEEEIEKINGRPKGIQGHCNSCYLDATLFAMFSFTSVFDSILLSDATLKSGSIKDIELAQETQRILREDIVNPLRKDYLTPAANVMNLRTTMYHLDDKLTSEEMDPQEFLQILFHNVLNLDEFISLSSGESDFFHQVLCDVTENDREQIPTVQQLFEQSLGQQNLKLKSIPRPALILQMPRSGNKYKTYKGILPNLTIDITDLIDDTPRECAICGELATHECRDCYGHFSSTSVNESHSGADSMSFCDTCVTPVHNKPERSSHKNIQPIKYSFPTDHYFLPNLSNPNPSSSSFNHNFLNNHTNGNGVVPNYLPSYPAGGVSRSKPGYGTHRRIPRVTMDLFAVICIETSHFVSFVKAGIDKNAPWVFFDSMADRCDSGKGHNIPQVKMLPKMGNWLSHLENQSQEQIRGIMGNITPELKRLLNDPYICLYYSPQSAMYI